MIKKNNGHVDEHHGKNGSKPSTNKNGKPIENHGTFNGKNVEK